MSTKRPTYYFTISVDGGNWRSVYPRYGDDLEFRHTRVEGTFAQRRTLSTSLIFSRGDFDFLNALTVENEVEIYIDREVGNSLVRDWTGFFTKADAEEINEDEQTFTVTPQPRDAYEKLMAAWDKEFNLIDLEPAITGVNLRRRPIIQVYPFLSGAITNILDRGTYWEQQVTVPRNDDGSIMTTDELAERFHFSVTAQFFYITGPDGVNPDIRGLYTGTLLAAYRTDGRYRFDTNAQGLFNYVVDELTGQIVYESPLGQSAFNVDAPFSPGAGLTSEVDGSSFCNCYYITLLARIITKTENIGGQATLELPANDIAGENANYDRALPLDLGSLIITDAASTEPTKWGKFVEDAINHDGEYFAFPDTDERYLPVNRSDWREISVWVYFTEQMDALQQHGGQVFNLKNAYEIGDVMRAFLRRIDPGLIFEKNTEHSDFLYNPDNAIRKGGRRILISPKSNVLFGEYDRPASRALLKPSEAFNLLRYGYNCFWHLDGQKLRIEHRNFYEQGDYLQPIIAINTFTALEPKTGQPWGRGLNRYRYEKAEMPEEITIKWMDEVSPAFRGYPIRVTSRYVQAGNLEEWNLSRFTSDIDFMMAQPGGISPDGFVLLEALEQNVTVIIGGAPATLSGLFVLFLDFEVSNDERYYMQNGYASTLYLIDTYHRHGLPAENVEINGQATTATTVARRRVQDVEFPAPADEFDYLGLVVTSGGTGQLRDYSINLATRIITATIEHEN